MSVLFYFNQCVSTVRFIISAVGVLGGTQNILQTTGIEGILTTYTNTIFGTHGCIRHYHHVAVTYHFNYPSLVFSPLPFQPHLTSPLNHTTT